MKVKIKMNKILLSLLIIATVVGVPGALASKGKENQTITLTSENTLVLNSEVNGDSVGALIVKARELDAAMGDNLVTANKPLYLYLNTPGGSVQSGLELIEAFKGLKRPVHTVTAFAASMGFQIVENLSNRYILESGIMMSHRAAGEFAGSFGGTTPSQLDQRIRIFTQITKEMDEQTVKRTNGKQTLESYQKSYNSELWMTGKESIDRGYSDSMVLVKCDKSLAGTTTHHVEFLGADISYDLDNCPINTAPLNVKVGSSAGASKEYIEHIKHQFLSGYELKMTTALPMVF